jgi:cysteine desulfurase
MKNKEKQSKKRVFLDYASTTPIDGAVLKTILKAEEYFWANPSSLHQFGDEAKEAQREAKFKIAQILHCRANEIFFTSGGTEALNLAIFGVVQTAEKQKVFFDRLPHVITSTIEHPAVLEPIKFLAKEGRIEVSFLTPDQEGFINPDSVKKELKTNTVLVAIQHANNELGVIEPILKIAGALREFKKSSNLSIATYPYLLVDASQSVLFEDVSIERLKADLLVVDGIKMYGPRGVGVLVVKNGTKISPIILGGGQEGGLRSGTENVPAICGLAKALEIAVEKRKTETTRLKKLRDYAIKKILDEYPEVSLNGSIADRLPNNLNLCFPGQDSEFLVIKLDLAGFAVSAASACHSLNLENGSYVVESLGKPECKSSSLRITLGRSTTKADLDRFISALKKILNK